MNLLENEDSLSHITSFFLSLFSDKNVVLVGGGSVIKGYIGSVKVFHDYFSNSIYISSIGHPRPNLHCINHIQIEFLHPTFHFHRDTTSRLHHSHHLCYHHFIVMLGIHSKCCLSWTVETLILKFVT